ncbi:hypothetical protein MKW98_000385 [Papaver atlanticum]|uniref:Uncharacterized protein n=1 Tax=Papaver atlanticum TaxID=357466 RepID=A0AAD4S3Y6_9MAGN|nr:hypothetical protein MKW98_000385 [Papaver atlanticum]
MAYRNSQSSYIFQVFTLNPLPYPVLIILSVISIFLGISWYYSYEDVLEEAEEQISWVVKASPIVLLIIVQWLSTIENPERFFAGSPYDRQRRTRNIPSEGAQPWIVAGIIVVLLVMVSYQSTFQDGWLIS